MNPYAHYPVIQLHQAEQRRAAEHHRLVAAARRSGGTWWSAWLARRATPWPVRPTVLRPVPVPTQEAGDRAA